MSAFPTLPVTPTLPIPRKRREAAIKSPTEAGYEQARPRHTRSPQDFGPIEYTCLLAAEKDLIDALDIACGDWGIFTWTMPIEGTTHNVRFKERPTFKLIGSNIWACSFSLAEV